MLDRVDKAILHELQQNGRISNLELAEKVALSPSPCSRRVKQLEDAGYIKDYVAELDPEKLNLTLNVLVSVGLDSHEPEVMQAFETAVQAIPEVMSCYLIAGQAQDYQLRVVMPDMESYQQFLLKDLTQLKGVRSIHSSFIMRDIVNQRALPLSHV